MLLLGGGLVLLAISVIAFGAAARRPIGEPPAVPENLEQLGPEIATLIRDTTAELRRDPRRVRGWMTLALVYEANEFVESAERCYEQAIRLDPTVAQCWYHLALMLGERGDPVNAIETMQRAIDLDHEYAPAFWRVGHWHLELQNLDAAFGSFERARGIDPSDEAARFGVARVHLLRDELDDATALLEALAAADGPNRGYAQLLLADAHRRSGRGEELPSPVTPNPEPPRWRDPWAEEAHYFKRSFGARLSRAVALLESERPKEAAQALEALARLRPDDVTVLVNLAVAYIRLERLADAVRVLDSAVQRFPDHFAVHLNLASALQRSGDSQAALAHATAACELNPGLAQAHDARAAILLALNDEDAALAALQRALELEPSDTVRQREVARLQRRITLRRELVAR